MIIGIIELLDYKLLLNLILIILYFIIEMEYICMVCGGLAEPIEHVSIGAADVINTYNNIIRLEEVEGGWLMVSNNNDNVIVICNDCVNQLLHLLYLVSRMVQYNISLRMDIR